MDEPIAAEREHGAGDKRREARRPRMQRDVGRSNVVSEHIEREAVGAVSAQRKGQQDEGVVGGGRPIPSVIGRASTSCSRFSVWKYRRAPYG